MLIILIIWSELMLMSAGRKAQVAGPGRPFCHWHGMWRRIRAHHKQSAQILTKGSIWRGNSPGAASRHAVDVHRGAHGPRARMHQCSARGRLCKVAWDEFCHVTTVPEIITCIFPVVLRSKAESGRPHVPWIRPSRYVDR